MGPGLGGAGKAPARRATVDEKRDRFHCFHEEGIVAWPIPQKQEFERNRQSTRMRKKRVVMDKTDAFFPVAFGAFSSYNNASENPTGWIVWMPDFCGTD